MADSATKFREEPKPFNDDRGWLGEREQALVVADIDPFYSTEGKPRPQMLPPPLTLVAHLPIIEAWKTSNRTLTGQPACRCGRFQGDGSRDSNAKKVRDVVSMIREFVEKLGYKSTVEDITPNNLAGALKELAEIAMQGNPSDWLMKRANAYLAEHRADPTEWPPPACLDWLFVDLGDTAEVNGTRIQVPAYSHLTGDPVPETRHPDTVE